MAFRTNKVPVLQEKSASGSVATFNTALAMPLVKCDVAFSASQSGSGTPSTQNIRPITPVSSIDLLANSVPVIIPLGNSYGSGTLDLIIGKLNITYMYEVFDIDDYIVINVGANCTSRRYRLSNYAIRNATQMCNIMDWQYSSGDFEHYYANDNNFFYLVA